MGGDALQTDAERPKKRSHRALIDSDDEAAEMQAKTKHGAGAISTSDDETSDGGTWPR